MIRTSNQKENMDYFQFHGGKKNEQKSNKKRLSQEQVRLLEASFDATQKLDPDRKSQLAQELGLPPRQVAIWYQNKRARWRSQSLEVDYKALQLRLENALEDNQRLETEVQRLRQELDKLAHHRHHDHDHQDTLVVPFNFKDSSSSSSIPANDLSLISSSCDEVGSSGSCLLLDHHHSKLRLLDKELYACFNIGAAEGHDFFAPSIS